MPEDSSPHSLQEISPDSDLHRRALAAAMAHPAYPEAAAHVYCQPNVLRIRTSFFAGTKDAALRQALSTALPDADHLLAVSFLTSPVMPQPLAGGGTSYDFLLNPGSLTVFYFSTGTWRS